MTYKLKRYVIDGTGSAKGLRYSAEAYLASEADALIGVLGAEVALSGSRIAAYAAREQQLRKLADRWETFAKDIRQNAFCRNEACRCAAELRAILNKEEKDIYDAKKHQELYP